MKPKTLITATLVSALLATAGAFASERMNHDAVLKLRESGEILPIEEILVHARKAQPGQIVEVELDQEDDKGYVYEIKTIDADGRLHKLYLDASTGAVLKRKSRD